MGGPPFAITVAMRCGDVARPGLCQADVDVTSLRLGDPSCEDTAAWTLGVRRHLVMSSPLLSSRRTPPHPIPSHLLSSPRTASHPSRTTSPHPSRGIRWARGVRSRCLRLRPRGGSGSVWPSTATPSRRRSPAPHALRGPASPPSHPGRHQRPPPFPSQNLPISSLAPSRRCASRNPVVAAGAAPPSPRAMWRRTISPRPPPQLEWHTEAGGGVPVKVATHMKGDMRAVASVGTHLISLPYPTPPPHPSPSRLVVPTGCGRGRRRVRVRRGCLPLAPAARLRRGERLTPSHLYVSLCLHRPPAPAPRPRRSGAVVSRAAAVPRRCRGA